MCFQISAIAVLLVFYAFYIAKIILQRRQSIRTNQMGIGNKPKRVLLIERLMGWATVLTLVTEVCSILLVRKTPAVSLRLAGLVIGMLAILFFAAATVTMKTSWRVGIPEEITALITNGIYQYSRNPAFVGFDLLYASMCLMFFNIPLLIVSVWAAVMLHIQILQEEHYLTTVFAKEYLTYMKHTSRYWGKQ